MGFALTNIILPNSVATSSPDGVLFDKNQDTLIAYPSGKVGTYAMPDSVTAIAAGAFLGSRLTNVATGNSVTNTRDITDADAQTIVYYLPGTTGWGESFGGPPAVLWNPKIPINNAGAALGFTVVGTSNIPFVLEAAANLSAGPWTPLQTGTLTNGLLSFSDPEGTNSPARFYRVHSP